jgi:hypothetical protein
VSQLNLFEPPEEPDDAVEPWEGLDEAQRAEVVAALARLMSKIVATTSLNKEKANER